MLYNIYKKVLRDVVGDPAWLQPVYGYEKMDVKDSNHPIQKGDYIDDREVIKVEHNKDETRVIIRE